MKRIFPLHIHISTLFLLLIVLVGGLIGGVSFKFSRDMLTSTAADLTQRISYETLDNLRQLVAPAEMATNLIRHDSVTKAKSFEERWQRLKLFTDALKQSDALTSIYVGNRSGDFFLVRRIADDEERALFEAPPGTAFIVQSVERHVNPPRGYFVFVDTSLRKIREDDRPEYAASFDPRNREWYRDAVASGKQIRTPPYLFFTTQKVGTTIAVASVEGHAVIGADILFETINHRLARHKITPGTLIVLATPQGDTLAHEDAKKLVHPGDDATPNLRLSHLEDLGVPVLAKAGQFLRDIRSTSAFSSQQTIDGIDWSIAINPVVLDSGRPFHLIFASPTNELLAAAIALRQTSALITLLVLLIAIPVTWLMARAIAAPLRALQGDAESIRHFDFSHPVTTRSMVLEVNTLSQAMNDMKQTIRRFLDINEAMAKEEDFDRLLPMLLRETIRAAKADAGALYLFDENCLIPSALLRRDGAPLAVNPTAQELDQAPPLLQKAIQAGTPFAGELTDADIAACQLDSASNRQTLHFGVGIPLLNRQKQLIGAMLLLLEEHPGEALVSFVRALSGAMASSLETRELIKAQKALFEAFVQLIAVAIDAKSPYTGGHCARVPELTKMLARAACAETEGPFKDFHLAEREWEAVHVAAWLHDCGKVTTPEYVVDKATKLETIYDRIHEVRMRFEVLKRDAEISALKAVASGGDPVATAQALDENLQQIDDDYAFVCACNEGGEFLAKEKADRLQRIAEQAWTRTLDDRIGISHEERERKARTPAATLPATEPLLADKEEHRIRRGEKERIAENNPWGFRMPVPELLYNRGELYNLRVERGTLSEEERYKINEHIVQTLIMLSQLPFPKHLRQVPEIAGGHHEKMDGTGYPKRLKRDDLSPLARMMAIADIFEALTAIDRPYKKGKTLSEAIRIMSFMKKEGHIDPELFDLFLRRGVYRQYAETFMKPTQIDEVDVAPYLRPKEAS